MRTLVSNFVQDAKLKSLMARVALHPLGSAPAPSAAATAQWEGANQEARTRPNLSHVEGLGFKV